MFSFLKLFVIGLFFALSSSANAYHWSTQSGHYYDHQGHYQGRIDTNGRIYDESGKYLDHKKDGHHYDRNGRYIGHERNGRFYDEIGRYRGQVK